MAAQTQAVWQRGRVIDTRPVATGIQQIVLQVDRPQPAPPGSHVDIVIDRARDSASDGAARRGDSEDRTRSYSVVKADRGGSELTISVNLATRSRGGSRYMHTLRPGDQLRMTQPLQNFPLRIGAARYVLLAGGIGITALSEMASVVNRLQYPYQLVYVGRSRSRMAYLDDLLDLHGSNLRLHVSEESTPLDTAALVDEVAAGGPSELYMCGPIRLMDAVRRRWQERGLPAADLRYETFGNTGWFDAEEFVVEVPRLGVVTTVGSGQTLLEALAGAGVDIISDCRKGECGLCQVRVLGVDGIIDHRDVFFSDAQKDVSTKMCACISRAVRTGPDPAGWRPMRDAGRQGRSDARAIVTIDVP